MAYTKTTWNNLSDPPINADNLNKIEQGIYDNSLGIDKINPSGTATTTAEIEEGQVTDVIGFKSLKLKGQTSQYTTTGKNKLAIKQLTTQTINGVTFTPHYTGNKLDYVNVNGTATATAGYFLDNASIDQASTYTNELPSGTYILDDFSGSSSVNTAIFFRYSTDNSTLTTINSVENSRKITIDSTFKFASYIRIASGATVNNMKFYPQLETGSTQTTYEPFTNGASPNPDFPQDVNNVSGDNVVRISNKNILPNPIQSQTLNGITITRNSDGTLLINGTATANTYFDFSTDFDTTKYAGYKFYGFPDNPGFFIRISKSNRVALQDISSNGTVISDNGTGNHIAIRIAGGANVNNRVLSPMIIAPTITDTTYTAHQGNDFEINLGAIELCQIGLYQDYIYKKDGKWFKHKEIEKIVIDETYNWTRETSSSWVCPGFYCTTLPDLGTTVNGTVFNNSLCNMATVGSTSDYTQNENVFLLRRVNNTNRIDCMFDLESVDDLKSILADENMLVYYGLITPIDEEITYTPLIRQLDELYNSGLYDVTNISQDNSNEAFILDLEACKNNFNGIVEYIRR